MRSFRAALLLLPLLAGGAPPEDFLGVKEWSGSYSITISGEANESGNDGGFLPWTKNRKISRLATAELHLSKRSSSGVVPGRTPDMKEMMEKDRFRTWHQEVGKKLGLPPVLVDIDDSYAYDGTLPVEARVVDKIGTRTTLSGHGEVRKYIGDLPTLVVDVKKKVYHLVLPYRPINDIPTVERNQEWTEFWNNLPREERTTVTRKTGAEMPDLGPKINPSWILDQPLPDGPTELTGSVTYEAPIKGFKTAKQKVVIEWKFSPLPPDPVELIVSPEKGYADWRPKGSLSESTAGNRLKVKAVLQKKGGGEPDLRAKKITFKFRKVSREPGIAINYPENPKTPPDPDLKFEASGGSGFKFDDEQTITLEQPGLKRATAVISSYDYGAFGLLQVTAVLSNGREVRGEVEGDPGRQILRIPKSADDSWIADSWKAKANAKGPDDADVDNDPVGDGNKGDGLTLYEEYRGYIQDGHWSWLDPNKKDFFIFDEIGGRSKSGIGMFRDATGLQVHHRLKPGERGRKNVINCNAGEGAHKVAQHGVRLTSFGETAYAIAMGGPGTPKDIDKVCVPFYADVSHASQADQDKYGLYWERMLAHELGHCCNIYHHGDKDTDETWMVDQDKDGAWKIWRARPRANADPSAEAVYDKFGLPVVRLYREPRQYIPPPSQKGILHVWIGEANGQHSGFESCFMRYDCADVYRKANNEFYWIAGQEQIGSGLCTVETGVDVNKEPRDPKSRYGKADLIRGKCKMAVCVNDGAEPPDRGVHEEKEKKK